MNIEKVLQQIMAAAPPPKMRQQPEVVDQPKVAPKIVQKNAPKSSIPQEQIDEAIEIANFVRDKVGNLLSEAELALQDLNGESKPSVLESQDDFKSLVLRLKQMKKKLSVV